ncbi:MAG: ATP-binding protein [Tannerella sp.]|jgi:AAA15 family ATPase/GTPase|nr:ATP-binding protein [Tannerella sp.]
MKVKEESSNLYPLLKVRNFGPLAGNPAKVKDEEGKEWDLIWPINRFNIFIGPQATGKSTLAKLAYFFMTVKDEVFREACDALLLNIKEISLKKITGVLVAKFFKWFGAKDEIGVDFLLQFSLKKGYSISISMSETEKGLLIDFTQSLVQNILKLSELVATHVYGSERSDNILWNKYKSDIFKTTNKLFFDNRSTIYIPSDRNDSIFPEHYVNVPESPEANYKNLVWRLQVNFSNGLKQTKDDYMQIHRDEIFPDHLSKIIELSMKIMKNWDYRYDVRREYLYNDELDERIAFSLASSGQQVGFRIIEILYYAAQGSLEGWPSTLLIEEPELNLFPDSQMYMVQLIALFANLSGNRVILTTHSPYILSTVDNLLYASHLGKQQKEKTNEILPSLYWVNFGKLGAYYLDNGMLKDIREEKLKQIKTELIDSVSDTLLQQYDELLNLDTDEETNETL